MPNPTGINQYSKGRGSGRASDKKAPGKGGGSKAKKKVPNTRYSTVPASGRVRSESVLRRRFASEGLSGNFPVNTSRFANRS